MGKRRKKILKLFRIFVTTIVIIGWSLTTWRIPYINFPPNIQEAKALIAVQSDATEANCTNAATCPVTLNVSGTATMVVVAVMVRNGETITSVSDGEFNTYDVAYSQGTDPTVAVYYATTITPNASKTITANLSASTADTVIDAYTLTGTETSSPIDATATNTASGAALNASITTNSNNSLIAYVAGQVTNGTQSLTGADQVLAGTITVGGGTKYAAINSTEITTSSGPNDQTSSSTKSAIWRAIAVEIKIAPAATTLTQNDFEWFEDQTTLALEYVWGNPDIPENGDLTAVPVSNSPPSPGDKIRLQINLEVTGANLSAGAQDFVLQYKVGTDQDCSTGSWTDVGAISATGVAWRYFDNASLTHGDTQVNQIDSSTGGAEGDYVEIDPTQTNPNAVNVGQSTEWDFAIESLSGEVADATSYAFRLIQGGTGYTVNYSVGDCPTLEMAPGMSDLMRHGNFFVSGLEKGFYWTD